MVIYTVQSGDSVYTISREFGVPVSRIINDNSLTNPDVLVVGQKLLILYPDQTYLVRLGDTITSIADNAGISTQQLVQNNPFLLDAPPQAGETLVISYPDNKSGNLAVNGFFYPNINPDLFRLASLYQSSVALFSYGIRDNGTLISPTQSVPDLEALLTIDNGTSGGGQGNVTQPDSSENTPELIESEKITLEIPQKLMTVTTISESGTFSTETARAFLSTPDIWENTIQSILTESDANGYQGIIVDFEYIPENLGDAYVSFIRLLKSMTSLPIIVALAPKISDDQPGLLYEAHNYRELGNAADAVILMTYEWGYTYGPPRAVAPIDQVRRVAEYALTRIPAEKIMLGIPNYGYDWTLPYVSGESRAKSISNPGAIEIAAQNSAAISYDDTAQSPYFRYNKNGVEHEVWFEDAQSIQSKLDLANELGLRGISYWTLMRPFPQNWTLLNISNNKTAWPNT